MVLVPVFEKPAPISNKPFSPVILPVVSAFGDKWDFQSGRFDKPETLIWVKYCIFYAFCIFRNPNIARLNSKWEVHWDGQSFTGHYDVYQLDGQTKGWKNYSAKNLAERLDKPKRQRKTKILRKRLYWRSSNIIKLNYWHFLIQGYC